MTNDTLDWAMTVGAAIQLAWSRHRDLPPIEMTDDEMRYLGKAAIAAMSGPVGGQTRDD